MSARRVLVAMVVGALGMTAGRRARAQGEPAAPAVTRGKGLRPSGEHVNDLIPVYFAEITSLRLICTHA